MKEKRVLRRDPDLGQNEGAASAPGDLLEDVSLAVSRAVKAIQALELSVSIQPPDVTCGINFYDAVRRFEIVLIQRALKCAGGSQSRAACLLGLNATTLNSKIKTYHINWKCPT